MITQEELIKSRDNAIKEARWILMNPYFIIDTETTGLFNAEMCQIAVLKNNGTAYKSLVKPTIPIEEEAVSVHHITNEAVKDAPLASKIILDLPVSGFLLGYNISFDLKVIRQSMLACGIDYSFSPDIIIQDIMPLYAKFHGEWDDYHMSYRWQKLGVACKQCGIEDGSEEFHDALYDVRMTEKLLKYISCQKLSTESAA